MTEIYSKIQVNIMKLGAIFFINDQSKLIQVNPYSGFKEFHKRIVRHDMKHFAMQSDSFKALPKPFV